MNPNLRSSLDRADELQSELKREYQRSLEQRHVSARAIELTHEVCEKLRGILDRLARNYWEQHVSPQLSDSERKQAKVYFPICGDQQSFDSLLGRWRWKSVRDQQQSVYEYLLELQPFHNKEQNWLAILNDLAVQGKHIDLLPQKRFENRVTTVNAPGGPSISWASGVTFSGEISIMGAPIDPRTQRIVPTPGYTDRVEVWVSFTIAKHGVNALGFCQEACKATRGIVEQMSAMFSLS